MEIFGIKVPSEVIKSIIVILIAFIIYFIIKSIIKKIVNIKSEKNKHEKNLMFVKIFFAHNIHIYQNRTEAQKRTSVLLFKELFRSACQALQIGLPTAIRRLRFSSITSTR